MAKVTGQGLPATHAPGLVGSTGQSHPLKNGNRLNLLPISENQPQKKCKCTRQNPREGGWRWRLLGGADMGNGHDTATLAQREAKSSNPSGSEVICILLSGVKLFLPQGRLGGCNCLGGGCVESARTGCSAFQTLLLPSSPRRWFAGEQGTQGITFHSESLYSRCLPEALRGIMGFRCHDKCFLATAGELGWMKHGA